MGFIFDDVEFVVKLNWVIIFLINIYGLDIFCDIKVMLLVYSFGDCLLYYGLIFVCIRVFRWNKKFIFCKIR